MVGSGCGCDSPRQPSSLYCLVKKDVLDERCCKFRLILHAAGIFIGFTNPSLRVSQPYGVYGPHDIDGHMNAPTNSSCCCVRMTGWINSEMFSSIDEAHEAYEAHI